MQKFEKFYSPFFGGIASGLMVAIGGTVLLSCENRVVGSVLFAVALLAICSMGLYLYTGRIGFVGEKYEKGMSASLAVGLLGNFLGAVLTGILMRIAKPDIIEKAESACESRLESGLLRGFLLGCFCGVLMYAAVKIYKIGSPLGVIYCIPVFILSGFEHSVADMFYFSLAGMPGPGSIMFVIAVILGNTVGAVILALLWRLSQNKGNT